MRIAFLHLTMGLVQRGSEISTDLLATQLSKRHEVLVLQSGKASKKSYKVKRVSPLSAAPSPAPQNVFEKVLFRLGVDAESQAVRAFTRAAIPALTKFKPDIIVAVNGAPQLRVLQGQSLQGKIVVFGRAGIGHHDRATLMARPDLFVALSQSAQSWAKQLASPSTKVIYLPNPIATKKSKPVSLPLNSPVIVTVSALSTYKNITSVIQAVGQTDASYLLIGDGEDSDLVSQELSQLTNEFSWIKHLDPSELPGYYRASHVFCHIPDPQESFGRVYLEAMVAGLPIVASDDPIRRDLIGPAGIYVDPHDPASIVAGLSTALKRGVTDYQIQLKRYDVKTITRALEKEFYDLLK